MYCIPSSCTVSSRWYYVSMYWIAEGSGFRANPEIRIRIKILLTEFPDAVLLHRINDKLPFTLHLPSSIPLGDLWRARQRIDIPPSIPPSSLSGVFPRETRKFFIHAIPVTCLAKFIHFTLSTSSKLRIFSSKLP